MSAAPAPPDPTRSLPAPAEAALDWRGGGVVAALAALLSSAVLMDLWFAEAQWLPTHVHGDTIRSFVYMRSFGYAEIAHGNLPLWNPYSFSGAPFVGSFQSALFYPLNLHYLVLPHVASINLEFILHQALLAGLTFVWVRSRRCSREAAFVAALIVAFAAPTSLRVLAGQLSVIDTYAWFPLLLLCVDRLIARPSLGWTLAGIGAVSMMVLAGHPPTVLMSAVAAGLWVVLTLPWRDRAASRLARLVPVAVAPLLLTAAQLWPGLHTASESLRSGGMNYAFATSHSFPPLQLLTLLVPEVFGHADLFNHSYFGRVFFWDATAYIGIVGLLLAGVGMLHARALGLGRELAALLLLLLLSFGSYTPLYQLLYAGIPGFALIRAPSKFLFFAVVFAALLAAAGFDRVVRDPAGARRLRSGVALVLGLLAVQAIWLWLTPSQPEAPGAALALLEWAVGERSFTADGDRTLWHALALRGVLVALVLGAVSFALLTRAAASERARDALIGLLMLELVTFAWLHHGGATMPLDFDGALFRVSARPSFAANRIVHVLPREMFMLHDNDALGLRRMEVWGYDPVVQQRYARFVAFTQDIDLDELEMPTLMQIERMHPLLGILRAGTVLSRPEHAAVAVPGALPRFFFVSHVQQVADQAAALAALALPGFDPLQSVVLEEAPEPAVRGAPGRVHPDGFRVLGESTDHVELEFALDQPAVLVMTDAHADGWRARALEGASQTAYRLLPADAVVRGVPLAAGRHRLRIEFAPWASRAGQAVSMVSLGLYLATAGWAVVRHRRVGRLRAHVDGGG